MATITINDFREVKAMLRADWPTKVIMERSGWSKKTVQRIRNSRSFKAYRSRVYDETESVRRAREEKLANKKMDFEGMAVGETHVTIHKRKGIRRLLPWIS